MPARPEQPAPWHTVLAWMSRGCKTGGAPSRASHDWHTIIALSMVVVATVGALVAGGTAIAEQEAHRLQRLLAWGQHLALTQRAEWLAEVAVYETLDQRIVDYETHGRALLENAQRLGNNATESAAWLKLQAQEELAAARSLIPFLYVLWHFPKEKAALNVEQKLQKRLAFPLARQGFDTRWHEPPGAAPDKEGSPPPSAQPPGPETPESSRIWEALLHRLERAHRMVPLLAGGVVLLVLPLLLFTLARTRCGLLWKRRLLLLGWLLAAVGFVSVVIIMALYRDLMADVYEITTLQPLPAQVAFLATPLLLLALLVFSGVDLIRVSFSAKARAARGPLVSENVEPASVNVPLLEPNTGFSRLIVSLIAITALCTALCGWGYSLAASKAGEAAHRALEQGVEMHTRSSRLNAVTNQMLLQLFNIQEYTARLLAAFEGARHLKTYKDDSVDRIKDYRAILAKYQPWIDRGFMEDPTFGMQADKNFPDKLKYNWMKPEVLQEQAFARWDACSQRSLTWQALARIFLGILTVLAMAIYLFGQAHGMGEGPWAERLIFYGLLLLLIAVACSLVTLWPGSFQTREEVAEDEKAAQLFALVHQKLKTARSPQDYREVVPYLEKLTTELRPNFVKIPFAPKTDWTRCLPAGRYRAEIYVNGRLSPLQPAANNSAGNFACWKLFDLNLALCCPENWQPLNVMKNIKDAPLEVRIDSFLARGLATDKVDGKPAAFFFTFYPTMSGGSTPQEREALAVKAAKALLTRWQWLDETAVCNRYDPTRGCDSETPSGEVEYRYWETDEGVQHVGLVLLAAAPLNDLSHTLHSVSNLYRPLKVAGAGP